MDPEHSSALRELLRQQDVAALGTLRRSEPFVSLVPYALLADGALVVHVSRLATHTRDMEEHPGVSVMVMAPRRPDVLPQALARVTLQGDARPCGRDDPDHATAREAYLARFPESEPMFGFADFSLFRIVPRSARFVGGFAQAGSLTGDAYARLMAGG
jgi:putative heme iron utilization protein